MSCSKHKTKFIYQVHIKMPIKIKFNINYVVEEIQKEKKINIRHINYTILKPDHVDTPSLFSGIYKIVDFDVSGFMFFLVG